MATHWTEKEVGILLGNYASEGATLVSETINRTVSAVRSKYYTEKTEILGYEWLSCIAIISPNEVHVKAGEKVTIEIETVTQNGQMAIKINNTSTIKSSIVSHYEDKMDIGIRVGDRKWGVEIDATDVEPGNYSLIIGTPQNDNLTGQTIVYVE